MKRLSHLRILDDLLRDIWEMDYFNYQIPADYFNKYWDEECILHPTNSPFKIYYD